MTKALISLSSPHGISEQTLLNYLKERFPDSSIDISFISSPIVYPNAGAEYIKGIKISFNTSVSKDAVESIVKYWGEIPYVGNFTGVDFIGDYAIVRVDVSKTRSHDVNARNILELLYSFLEEGTPPRKRDGLRAVEGLGLGVVKRIVGLTT